MLFRVRVRSGYKKTTWERVLASDTWSKQSALLCACVLHKALSQSGLQETHIDVTSPRWSGSGWGSVNWTLRTEPSILADELYCALRTLLMLMLMYTMAVGSDKLIRPLTGLVFIPAGCRATLHTSKRKKEKQRSREAGGGAGLDANHPSMQQVVPGYMLPAASANLTWPDLTKQRAATVTQSPYYLCRCCKKHKKGSTFRITF